jgi:HSP20 family protein
MKDLVKRTDTSPMGRLFGLSRFHDDFFPRFGALMDEMWSDFSLDATLFDQIQPKGALPKVNVKSTDCEYKVDIAVAGFDKGDVELELKDNALFIKADKQDEAGEQDEEGTWLRREIAQRSFRRVVKFPEQVDTEKIDCNYENGVISCSIGKVQCEPEDATIKIDIK